MRVIPKACSSDASYGEPAHPSRTRTDILKQ